jgi:hypothetical protein
MKRDKQIKFTEVKLDTLIDIKLDSGIYIDNDEENHIVNEVKIDINDYDDCDDNSPPRRCFSIKKELVSFIREMLKINPKII